ncbi:MAG: DUF3822 family protein [Thermoflavifilum sp.]|uniref:DUF3822 family protein n=1 Tax=Thermoflavifilum sp. TaxID=1968839 RepID=UPI0018A47046|nr:DUF3822 family protein [Thermoflavifilum sp.]QOR75863.1 MAG: DUF3822 family protein [Thermoflavifilum sp.]
MQITPAIQPIYSVDDPIMLQADTSCWTLLVQVGDHHLSYAIKNQDNTFINFKAYQLPSHNTSREHAVVSDGDIQSGVTSTLEFFLEHDGVLRLPYRDVHIGYDDPAHTVVPIDAYVEEAQQAYFTPIDLLKADDIVQRDRVEDCAAFNLFAVEAHFLNLLRKEFRKFHLHHISTAFLQAIFKLYPDRRGEQLFICFHQHHAYFLARRHEQLLYFHRLTFTSETDVLYHVLAVVKHFQMDLSTMRCVLGGEITRQSRLYELLYAYIPIIQWLSRPRPFGYVEAFTHYPGHFFFLNLALGLCE